MLKIVLTRWRVSWNIIGKDWVGRVFIFIAVSMLKLRSPPGVSVRSNCGDAGGRVAAMLGRGG